MAGGRGPLLQGPAQGKHIGRNTRSPIFLWSVRVKKTALPLDDELAVLEVTQIDSVVQLCYDLFIKLLGGKRICINASHVLAC
jgi:hypothetical protein